MLGKRLTVWMNEAWHEMDSNDGLPRFRKKKRSRGDFHQPHKIQMSSDLKEKVGKNVIFLGYLRTFIFRVCKKNTKYHDKIK